MEKLNEISFADLKAMYDFAEQIKTASKDGIDSFDRTGPKVEHIDDYSKRFEGVLDSYIDFASLSEKLRNEMISRLNILL